MGYAANATAVGFNDLAAGEIAAFLANIRNIAVVPCRHSLLGVMLDDVADRAAWGGITAWDATAGQFAVDQF